jgi:hypothetical protein
MKIFFLRLLFILAAVFLEFSFFDILFPETPASLLLIAGVVAWILIAGFPRALFMTVPLTALFDIVSTGAPGALTLYAIPLAYTTSFLSRRLLVEHRGIGMILYALFASIGALGYGVFDFLFFQSDPFPGITEIFYGLQSLFSFSRILFSVVLSLPLFIAAYHIIRRFEGYVGSVAQRDLSQVK